MYLKYLICCVLLLYLPVVLCNVMITKITPAVINYYSSFEKEKKENTFETFRFHTYVR